MQARGLPKQRKMKNIKGKGITGRYHGLLKFPSRNESFFAVYGYIKGNGD
jgi:hypothetical protein